MQSTDDELTCTNAADEPVQLVFSVIDEANREEIVTGVCPTASQLFELVNNAGWLGRTARPITMKQRAG